MKSGSNLERVLTAGKFAVTGELGPPRGADADAIREKSQHVKGIVDAINVTDNQTGVVRLSSLAAGTLLLREGLDPVLQMVVRDRNRFTLQLPVKLLGVSITNSGGADRNDGRVI